MLSSGQAFEVLLRAFARRPRLFILRQEVQYGLREVRLQALQVRAEQARGVRDVLASEEERLRCGSLEAAMQVAR